MKAFDSVKFMWGTSSPLGTYGLRIVGVSLKGISFLFAMALILSEPVRKDVFQCVHLDDRTFVAGSLVSFQSILREWQVFENMGRLKSNVAKTQIWTRTPVAEEQLSNLGFHPQDTIQVLGTTLGPKDRGQSAQEAERLGECVSLCYKIGGLPCSMRHKQLLATILASSKAVWGHLINNRGPTKAEEDKFAKAFSAASKHPAYPVGRAAPELRRAFFLGHASSLMCLATHRLLKTTSRWVKLSDNPHLEWNPTLVKQLQKIVEPWGWTAHPQGLDHPENSWSFNHAHLVDKFLHEVRTGWRIQEANRWLQSTRIDAGLARDEQVVFTPNLITQIKNFIQKADSDVLGHAVAVLSGGMSTATHISCLNRDPLPSSCPDCNQSLIPSLSFTFCGNAPHTISSGVQGSLPLTLLSRQGLDGVTLSSELPSCIKWPNPRCGIGQQREEAKSGRGGPAHRGGLALLLPGQTWALALLAALSGTMLL